MREGRNRVVIEWTVWATLLLVALVFYPWALTSSWVSNSDVHSLLEFWAASIALMAAGIVLIHFFATGRRFFVMISLGFMLQGTEDLIHAVYSFSRIWSTEHAGMANFVPGTYVTGRLLLVGCILLALCFRNKVTPEGKRRREAIVTNTIGFLLAAFATAAVIDSPLPRFILPGSIISRPVDFVAALIYLCAIFCFVRVHRQREYRTPFMWSLIGSLVLGFAAQIYMVHSQQLYDAQFDVSHILKILSYMLPVGGIAVGTFSMYSMEEQLSGDLHRNTDALRERVKELGCLYGIGRLVEEQGASLNKIVQGTVELIPPSWQYPGITCARIVLKDHEYRTSNYRETRWTQQEEIVVAGREVGTVEVCYLEEKPEEHEGPFYKEERDLLNAIAERLGRIVEQHAAQETLVRSEHKYRTLIENLPQTVFLKDKDLVYISCNEHFARNFGIRPEEVAGKTDRDFFPRELADKYRADDRRILETGVTEDIEEPYIQDGKKVWVHTVKTPLKDKDGNCLGVLGIFWDITEQKRQEEEKTELEARLRQAQKMEAIGTLAGGIAHDFNNILYALLGYTQVTMDEVAEDSKAYSNLKEIFKAGERATVLVDQILAFSRQTEQTQQPILLQPVIKESLKLLRASLPTTIDIRHKIDPKCSTILSDPVQVQQVLMNLCTNASQAMGEGSGTLEVGLTEEDVDPASDAAFADLPQGTYVHLTVTDTGCGMDEATLERIFEPYFTTRGDAHGTGLGLATVHGIVKSHRGAITVQSRPGEGTTFNVFFPVVAQKDARFSSADLAPLEDLTKTPIGTERVLLVDDEDMVVRSISIALKRLGYVVTGFTSSAKALEAFRSDPDRFDVVITDYTMPDLTGAALAKELLTIRADIPIILCTGYSERISGPEAKALGIQEYLRKPITRKALSKAIRRVRTPSQ